MKLGVIGTGYVGLVQGTMFANGNEVVCVDKDTSRIEMLNSLKMPLSEPGLEERVRKNVEAGRLKFSTSLEDMVCFADVLFVCVGTPPLPDGLADVSAVFDVGRNVAEVVKAHNIDYRLLVIKSTVPAMTTDKLRDELNKIVPESRLELAMNPEFLQEGLAVKNAEHPDRIVLGVYSQRAEKILRELYAPFIRKGQPVRVVSPRTAAFSKYGSNATLAVKLSHYNELANACDALEINVREVLEIITDDKRIGKEFMHPSGGYGGSCFPKDSPALVKIAEEVGVDLSVTRAGHERNLKQRTVLVDKIHIYFGDDLRGKTFGVWGLAFKKGTDDAREAPSVEIIEKLLSEGALVKAYDPEAMDFVRLKTKIGARIFYARDKYQVLDAADALVVCTEWPEFCTPDFNRIKSQITCPVIFDNKNLFDAVKLSELGIVYFGIGVENDLARAYRKVGK